MSSALLFASSLVFLYSALREDAVPIETMILAIANCLALIMVDVIFVVRKIISRVYLLDALLESVLLGALIFLI